MLKHASLHAGRTAVVAAVVVACAMAGQVPDRSTAQGSKRASQGKGYRGDPQGRTRPAVLTRPKGPPGE